MINGNDLIVLGLLLELAGGYFLSRGFLGSVSFDTARAFVGFNPHQIKALIKAHYDARTGFVWFSLGLVTSLLGTVMASASSAPAPAARWLIVIPAETVGVSAAVAICAAFVNRAARRQYVADLAQRLAATFAKAVFALRHDGRRAEEVATNVTIGAATRADRLREAQTRLERIADLFDEPMRPDETLEAVARRLAAYFPSDGDAS